MVEASLSYSGAVNPDISRVSARQRVDAVAAAAGEPAPDQMGATGTKWARQQIVLYGTLKITYFDLGNGIKIVTFYRKTSSAIMIFFFKVSSSLW